MKEVAIIGVGLMGGSLGLALKKARPDLRVVAISRTRDKGEAAVRKGAADVWSTEPASAVATADIAVCCAPILSIPGQVQSITRSMKKGSVITDVGSTKTDIQRSCMDVVKSNPDTTFIGSHPIAGSEQQGIEHAREDLYRGNLVVLTPDASHSAEQKSRVRDLWELAGGVVVEMSPEVHDKTLAATSHLPHMIASLLAETIGRAGMRPDLHRFCGTGYRDTTRIATGGVDIWLDILKSNRDAIAHELKEFKKELDDLIEKLERKDFSGIERHLFEGKRSRQAFTRYGNHINSEE